MGLVCNEGADVQRGSTSRSLLLARAQHEDAVEVRSRHLLSWTQTQCVCHLLPKTLLLTRSTLILAPLAASRHLDVIDLKRLSEASKGHCQALGQKEVVGSLLKAIVSSFDEARVLAESAVKCVAGVESEAAFARERLATLSRMQLHDLRLEASAASSRSATCKSIMKLASTILQPLEKAQDDFAVLRLVTEGRLVDLATSFRPSALHPARRKRFERAEAPQRELIDQVAVECTACGAVAQWLQAVRFELAEHAKVARWHRRKEALLEFAVPTAEWVMRPQTCRLGRAKLPAPTAMCHRGVAAQPRAWAYPVHRDGHSDRTGSISEKPSSSDGDSVRQTPPAATALPRPAVPSDSETSCCSALPLQRRTPGHGAGMALKQWLLEHGVPNHPGFEGQQAPAAAGQGASAVAMLKASKDAQVALHRHSSVCSSASTADGGPDRHMPTSREDLHEAHPALIVSLDVSSESDDA